MAQSLSNSFNFNEDNPSKVLLHCHAGCRKEDVLEKLGLSMKDLFDGKVLDRIFGQVKNLQSLAATQWQASCPAHDDRVASLSIALTHGGNTPTKIPAKIPDKAMARASANDVRLPSVKRLEKQEEIETVYDYVNAEGKLVYQVVRFKGKDFRQRRPNYENGGYIWNLQEVETLPYNLPEVLRAVKAGEPVLIVEGEKDADKLAEYGFTATCNSGGAGKFKPHLQKYFRNAKIIIIPDNDEAGLKHAHTVWQTLDSVAEGIKVLRLPGLGDKGDFSDWVAHAEKAYDNWKDEFRQLVLKAPKVETFFGTLPEEDEESEDGENTESFTLGDYKNVDRFIKLVSGNLKFIVEQKEWLYWDGIVWVADRGSTDKGGGKVNCYCRKVIPQIIGEAMALTDKKESEKVLKEAGRLSNRAGVDSMLTLAQRDDRITVNLDEKTGGITFDSDPYLLTVNNGTIDLRTGKLREHRREDYITHKVPFDYDPEAKCPEWLGLLELVLGGDKELIDYMHRVTGYCLTGDTSEKAFFVFWGSGNNGKTTLTETIAKMLGSHASNTPVSSFAGKSGVASGDVPSSDMARLRGSRMVFTSEIGQGQRLQEERIKALTGGGDFFTARHLYGKHFEFRPQFKIVMDTNYRPRVDSSTDKALWSRVHLIPFNVCIPEVTTPVPRPVINRKLEAEMPGILAWAVRGCLEWQNKGLEPPQIVVDAREDYREEAGGLADFLGDWLAPDANSLVTAREILDAYDAYCKTYSITNRLGQARLTEELRGFGAAKEQRRIDDKVTKVWTGIKLTEEAIVTIEEQRGPSFQFNTSWDKG